MAAQFAENLAIDNPEVDAAKQDCIRKELVALTADEYNSFITAGLDPANDDGSTRSLLEGILKDCGVDPATIDTPGP